MTGPEPAIAVHGGAGALAAVDDAARRRFGRGLRAAVEAGAAVLDRDGDAVDAAVAAVAALEADPVFNAGRGAVLTADGTVECSASVVDGATARAGAVALLRRTADPIRAAAALLDHRHVFLAGDRADDFAREHGCRRVANRDLVTAERRRQWERLREGAPVLDHDAEGTVGAVARDRRGHLAAATSTGGMTGQLPGRIGDSPLVGAGTWADARCAISATGEGEFFCRAAFARRCADLVELGGRDPGSAAREALDEVAALGGRGGAIVLGAEGTARWPFTAGGMLRAAKHGGEPVEWAIH